MTAPNWAGVAEFARNMMEKSDLPGLALAIARDGASVYAEGFGHRDRERDLPVTPDTVFGIASSTKSFTCMAMLQLEEAGRLRVSDPVVRYIPEFRTPDPEATRLITIHHFMTHSSGLPPLPSRFFVMARSFADDAAAEQRPDWIAPHDPIDTYEQLLAYIAESDYTLLGPPGSHFSYSNDGFALLGLILERVSGQSFEHFVREHILAPAGMTRSTFDVSVIRDFPDVTTLYAKREQDGQQEVHAAPVWMDAPIWSSAGRLKSNTQDLLRYLEIYRTGGMVRSERLLSTPNVERMLTPYIPTGNPNVYYGYGLMIRPNYHGVSVAGHGGGRKGISAYLCVARDIGFTGVGLANLGNVPTPSVVHAALNATLGLPLDTAGEAYRDYACPLELLAAYIGEYRSGESGRMTVTREDNTLVFTSGGQSRVARPVGEHAFVTQQDRGEAYSRFLIGGTGQAYALTSGNRILQRAPSEETGAEAARSQR